MIWLTTVVSSTVKIAKKIKDFCVKHWKALLSFIALAIAFLLGRRNDSSKVIRADADAKVKSMEDQIENERNLNIIYLKEREELLDKKSKELSEIDREKDDNIKNLSNNEEKLDKILQEDYNLEKGE